MTTQYILAFWCTGKGNGKEVTRCSSVNTYFYILLDDIFQFVDKKIPCTRLYSSSANETE